MPTSPDRERPSLPRPLALVAVAALWLAGCETSAGAFDLPWPPPSASPVASAAAPVGPSAPGSQRRRRASAAPSFECDELPPLTAEELAGPPYDFDLQKQKPSRAEPETPPRFTVLSGVTLSPEAAAALERIDDAYHKRTGQRLVITSGTRDAARQAKAMYKMIRLGADITGLYRNKAAAREIKAAYTKASAAGRPADAVVMAMYDTIRDQIGRGVYISAHLRAGAVDIRNRSMSASQKRAFEQSVAEVGGASLLEETKPPHYHLQLEPQ
jgi:hypothetical protein